MKTFLSVVVAALFAGLIALSLARPAASAPPQATADTLKQLEGEFMKAAAYSLVAAVLSFFGFIHGAQLAWMASPMVAVGYVLLGAICLSVAMSEPTQKAGAKTESALA